MLQNFSQLTVIVEKSCNFFLILTKKKLTNYLHRLLLYFLNFQEDILWNKKVILDERINVYFSHWIRLIHGHNL